MTTSTGPKISSWAIRILLSTSENTVGSTYQPFEKSDPDGRPPPSATVAPSSRPLSRYPSIRVRCRSATTGPTSVAGSMGSPTVMAGHSPRPPRRRPRRSGHAGARMRVCAMQACPLFMMALGSSVGIVVARSASSRMMAADLPPSSSVQRFSRSPQSPPMRLPPTPEPVKEILSTPGCLTRCSLTSRPAGTTDEHALGQPGLGEDLGQPEGVERRLRRRLVDHRAAGDQRGRQLGGGDEQRHVPRRDGADDADGLLGDQHLRVQQAGAHLVEGERRGQVGVVVEDHGRAPAPGPSPRTRSASPSPG